MKQYKKNFYAASNGADYFANPKTIKSIAAAVIVSHEEYYPNGDLRKILTDIHHTRSRFYLNGDIHSDRTTNLFISQDILPENKMVERQRTRYRRYTLHQPGQVPRTLSIHYEVQTPSKKKNIRSTMTWDSHGALELMTSAEFHNGKLVSRKHFHGVEEAETGLHDPNSSELNEHAFIRFLHVIAKWEKDFVHQTIPISPFALPFYVLQTMDDAQSR